MKKYLILSVILIICCKTNKNITFNKNSSIKRYTVYKIDSINDYFLIYLKKNDSVYRVISKKSRVKKCNEIKTNCSYAIELKSVYKDRLETMKKYNINKFVKWGIDDLLKINSDSIKYYYTSKNIEGKCLIPTAK